MDEIIATSLSPHDISVLWRSNPLCRGRPPPPVVMYDDLIASQSLRPYFRTSNCFILFYPNARIGDSTMGHYVAVIHNPTTNTVYFYDPYGFKPDTKQKDTPQRRMLYAEDLNTLVKMLHDDVMDVDYSPHKHQKFHPSVATCGRHAMMRCLMESLTTKQYDRFIRSLCARLKTTPDKLVALIFS